ncbi:MAG: autotransporter-associated beta strand repeat-containing protein, partial [Actinomycetota bacterium]|nr:autotransporter-associated beta strand repeat-containing protein [Actinomycetota bacterium]
SGPGSIAAVVNQFTSASTGYLALNPTNAPGKSITYAGIIRGSLGIAKTGVDGMVTLSGANTYTGGTSVFLGTLRLSGIGSAGAVTNAINVEDGAILDLNTDATNTTRRFGALGGAANVGGEGGTIFNDNATGQRGILEIGNGNSGGVFFGTIQDNSGTGGANGLIALEKVGTGTQILAGNNTYTGGTTISAGTLQIGNGTGAGSLRGNVVDNGSLVFNVRNFFFGGLISGSGSVTQASDADAFLSFTGNNTYTGGTFIDRGTLGLSSGGAIGNAGPITFRGGTLQYSGANQTDYSARIVNSPGAIAIDTNGQGITFASALTNTNTGGLIVGGGGTLTFSGASPNTYTGATFVNGGTLVLSKSNAGASTNFGSAMGGDLFINNGGTVRYGVDSQVRDDKSITVNAGGTLNLNGFAESITNLSVNGGSITTGSGYLNVRGSLSADSSSTSSYTGNLHLEAATANAARDILVASGGTFTVSGVIGNGDNGLATQLNKTGPGKLLLSGANTYTGNTRIAAGTLILANSVALQNSTLDLNGADTGMLSFGALTGATFGGLQGSHDLVLLNDSGNAVALTIGRSNTSTTYSGALSGTGSLTKTGAGTVTLTGSNANTYSGDTLVNAGTLVLAKGGQGPSNNFGSAMGGNLVINSGATVRYGADSQVRDDRSITVNAGGTLNMNGFAESITNLAINGGSVAAPLGYLNVRGVVSADSSPNSLYDGLLHLEAPTNGGAGTISVASGGTLSVPGRVFNGDNGFATQLNKIGGGTLNLSGINLYSGGTVVQGGTLLVNNPDLSGTG